MSHLATAIEALDNEINATYERAERLEQTRDRLLEELAETTTWTRQPAVYRDSASNDQFAIVDAEPAPLSPAELEVVNPSAAQATAAPALRKYSLADNFDPDEVDWEAVAACYKQATDEGRRQIPAIMNEFTVSRQVAKAWPTVCRRLGLLPPANQPHVDRVAS